MKKQVLVALVLLSLLTGYGLAVTASRVLADDEAGPAQVVRRRGAVQSSRMTRNRRTSAKWRRRFARFPGRLT